MRLLTERLPALTFGLGAVFLVAVASRSHNDTTMGLVVASIAMFACCWSSASHLLGPAAAGRFVAIALPIGWFVEQMGASRGWFFGSYTYTDVLGPRLGEVPAIIPLMWFALSYVGYVLANLIVWHKPIDGSPRLFDAVALSFIAAMLVTIYDMGADPYMVYHLKAWIMAKTDGWWFGETVQGFVGWMFVAFAIVFSFRLTLRRWPAPPPARPFTKWHALVPWGIYAGSMLFQIFNGEPVETRSIAALAMGLPLLCALAGWRQWSMPAPAGEGAR